MKTTTLIAAAALAVTPATAVSASDDIINITPTNRCSYVSTFALAAGTDRDTGATKLSAVTTLVTNGGHLAPELLGDLLVAIDLVYLAYDTSPTVASDLVYGACLDHYGEPL